MKYYQRLKDLREDEDLIQNQVAEILKTTQQQYSRWETGEYQIPFDKAIELSEYYNVSLDYLAGRTNNKLGIGYIKQSGSEHNSAQNNSENKYNATPNNKGNKYNITQNNNSGNNSINIKE